MGNTPVPIYHNRQGMTERQEQQQERCEVCHEFDWLPLALGCFGEHGCCCHCNLKEHQDNLSKGSQGKTE